MEHEPDQQQDDKTYGKQLERPYTIDAFGVVAAFGNGGIASGSTTLNRGAVRAPGNGSFTFCFFPAGFHAIPWYGTIYLFFVRSRA